MSSTVVFSGGILIGAVGVTVLVFAGFPLITGMENCPSLTIGATAFCVEHYNDLLLGHHNAPPDNLI